MCGIVGIYHPEKIQPSLMVDSMLTLQHRGQDAAGVAALDDADRISVCKGKGLMTAQDPSFFENFSPRFAIGHLRYPTAGTDSFAEIQPMSINLPASIALSHNGNLVNRLEICQYLKDEYSWNVSTDSDSEVILGLLATYLASCDNVNLSNINKAVEKVQAMCKGAFSIVALISNIGLIAFRDINGIRPLVYGTKMTESGISYMFASESGALASQQYVQSGDVFAGELCIVDRLGNLTKYQSEHTNKPRPCVFEWVYFSRPDAVIENASVYKVRRRMGKKLAMQIKENFDTTIIDSVIPIPESGNTVASALAWVLGKPLREGFVKNRYVGRTFIMANQNQRASSVRRKLSLINSEFTGKNVLLVDDSIVRGTTSKEIISLVRDAGAKNVFFASAAPPIAYPNVFGIDTPSAEELIASNRTIDEIGVAIGTDKIFFNTLTDLLDSVKEEGCNTDQFETSMFTGDYGIVGVDQKDIFNVGDCRAQAKNAKRQVSLLV